MNERRIGLRFCRGDWAAIGLVLLMIAGIFAHFLLGEPAQGGVVQVVLEGMVVREEPLETDCEFSVSGEYTNVVSIAHGRVAITESDCPGGDCMHSAPISAAGRSIVCLPNRLELRIVGAKNSEVDMIVG